GNMLIAERGGLRVRSVKPDGTISTIAGIGTVSFSGDGGPSTAAGLASPEGVAVAPDGTIYIADANNGAVRKVDSKGIITTFAGRGPAPNATGGPATGVSLGQPTAVAVDSQGNVYIAENSGNRARRVSPQGILTNLAGTGVAGFSGDGKSAVQATFASCFGLAVDPAGNVFISDRLNGRIRRVDPNGTVNTVAGLGPANGDGGPAANAVFAGPNEAGFGDIAADGKGNIYVADKAAQRVRKISPDGLITTIAGTGFPGNGADNIPATTSSLHDPAGLTIDNQGNLILADASTYTIRRLQSDGTFVTLARYPDVNFTNHVVVDRAGNIYFSSFDGVSEIVRKLAPNGTVTTFAGTSRRGFSGDGGPA